MKRIIIGNESVEVFVKSFEVKIRKITQKIKVLYYWLLGFIEFEEDNDETKISFIYGVGY